MCISTRTKFSHLGSCRLRERQILTLHPIPKSRKLIQPFKTCQKTSIMVQNLKTKPHTTKTTSANHQNTHHHKPTPSHPLHLLQTLLHLQNASKMMVLMSLNQVQATDFAPENPKAFTKLTMKARSLALLLNPAQQP